MWKSLKTNKTNKKKTNTVTLYSTSFLSSIFHFEIFSLCSYIKKKKAEQESQIGTAADILFFLHHTRASESEQFLFFLRQYFLKRIPTHTAT